MKTSWRDLLSGALIVLGGLTVFAKLQSYSWWLIGSWKGALGVITVLGLGILLTNIVEIAKLADLTTVAETLLWLATATVAIAGLFATTTKAEFISTAALVGLSWVAQFGRHIWVTTHSHGSHYVPVH
jgi:nitrate reductase gamma subunit